MNKKSFERFTMKMRKYPTTIVLIVFLALFSACGLLRDPAAPSSPIEATPLVLSTTAPTATTQITNQEPAAQESQSTQTPTAEPTSGMPEGLSVFSLSQAGSQVRFELDEDLRGERITVVGTTDQVAGEFAIDASDLSKTQVGTIQINARGLATDNNFRNRAIQNQILDTGSFEFITFTPTSVIGLSGIATAGETLTFSLQGDLTIRDLTLPVTFTVSAALQADGTITGTATAMIKRSDFGLNIPSVPNVANVEEEVQLTIDFLANPQ
jgi:polyisoprenoid-binding protein YceI